MMIQGLIPTLAAPLKAQSANAAAATGKATDTSKSPADSLQATFLNLLVTELQNQDPTSPVDPTAMVGQMVSLNQLDQLISINQTLQGMGTTAPTTPAIPGVSPSPTLAAKAPASGLSSDAAAALSRLGMATPSYADGSSLMNLYGSVAASTSPLVPTISGGR